MDPQQQQQQAANLMAGMGAGLVGFLLLFGLACILFFIWLYWRIFTKAGLAGPLALLFLIPGVGWLIVPCVLAFAKWNVTAVPPGYAPGEAGYPATYPPAGYPPTDPSPRI